MSYQNHLLTLDHGLFLNHWLVLAPTTSSTKLVNCSNWEKLSITRILFSFFNPVIIVISLSVEVFNHPKHSCGLTLARTMYIFVACASQSMLLTIVCWVTFIIYTQKSCNLCIFKGLLNGLSSTIFVRQCYN